MVQHRTDRQGKRTAGRGGRKRCQRQADGRFRTVFDATHSTAVMIANLAVEAGQGCNLVLQGNRASARRRMFPVRPG